MAFLGCWFPQLQDWNIWGKTKDPGVHHYVTPWRLRCLAGLPFLSPFRVSFSLFYIWCPGFLVGFSGRSREKRISCAIAGADVLYLAISSSNPCLPMCPQRPWDPVSWDWTTLEIVIFQKSATWQDHSLQLGIKWQDSNSSKSGIFLLPLVSCVIFQRCSKVWAEWNMMEMPVGRKGVGAI